MKKSLMAILGIFFLSGLASAAEKVTLNDETAQISYSLGYQIGGDFKKQNVNINPEAVIQGIQDALAAKEPALSQKEMTALLVSLKQKVVAEQRQESIRSSKEFLAANLKKEGVKELPGGTQYKVIQAGKGASPTLDDTVDIHYITTRADGSSVASTRTEKDPRSYEVKKMLPGLREALMLMKPGDKWEIVVPPSNRSEFTEKGVLIYELELVAVHPAAGKTN